jgi:hypothetical protein
MGKTFLLLAWVGSVAVAILLAGCGDADVPSASRPHAEADFSKSGPPPVNTKAVGTKATGAGTSASSPKAESPQGPIPGAAGSTAAEVNSVVNYATGATPLQVKKRVVQRLGTIQADHDRKLREAMAE